MTVLFARDSSFHFVPFGMTGVSDLRRSDGERRLRRHSRHSHPHNVRCHPERSGAERGISKMKGNFAISVLW